MWCPASLFSSVRHGSAPPSPNSRGPVSGSLGSSYIYFYPVSTKLPSINSRRALGWGLPPTWPFKNCLLHEVLDLELFVSSIGDLGYKRDNTKCPFNILFLEHINLKWLYLPVHLFLLSFLSFLSLESILFDINIVVPAFLDYYFLDISLFCFFRPFLVLLF